MTATVDGRPATLAYFKGEFDPASEADATLVQITFMDARGGSHFYVPDPAKREAEKRSIQWKRAKARAQVLLREFDESKHPRDERGRWTDGGGGDDSLAEDTESGYGKNPTATEIYESYKTPTMEEVRARLSPRDMEEIDQAKRDMEGRIPTMAQFKQPDGKYTPERVAVHADIIKNKMKLFSPENIAKYTPPAGEKPLVTLVGGRPASGKTTSLPAEIMESSLYISADDVQEHLPGYEPRLAGLFNGEAQEIGDRIEEMARELKINVIFDSTMKTQKTAAGRLAAYQQAGYEADGYFVSTSPIESAVRTVGRFRHKKGDYSGRFVPPEVTIASTTNEKTFDSLKSEFRSWKLFDNNGDKLKLVAEGGKGK
jgi:hypothetical protein